MHCRANLDASGVHAPAMTQTHIANSHNCAQELATRPHGERHAPLRSTERHQGSTMGEVDERVYMAR